MKTPDSTITPNQYRAQIARTGRRVKPIQRMRQALVMILSVTLFLTSLPMIGGATQTAQAQITQRICDPSQPGAANQIFQKCAISNGIEGALETEAINTLLTLHRLPAGDRGRLLGWERNEIRAVLSDLLFAAIQKAPAARTQTEQLYVTAVTNLVKQQRVLAATKALEEYDKWLNTCPYTPPPGFTFNNGDCAGVTLGLLTGRTAPSFDEFKAYGAFRAYEEIQNDPNLALALRGTAAAMTTLSGIAVVASTAAFPTVPIFTTLATITGEGIKYSSPLLRLIFPMARTISTIGGVIGPLVIIITSVITAIFRGIQVAAMEELPIKLQEAKNRAMNETPDLTQLLADNEGAREVFTGLMLATFPDFPATGGVPAPQASDPKFRLMPGNSVTPSVQYKDWDGNKHILRLNGGWFVDRKEGGPERLTLSIEYVDWTGKQRTASRVGAEFWHSVKQDESTPPNTPIEASSSLELQYKDANGAQMTARIENAAPTISTLSVTRRQEPPVPSQYLTAFPNANVSQIATVADLEDAAGSLAVSITSANPSNGITLSDLRVEADGKVFARVQPTCSAVVGNTQFTLQVRDSLSQTTTATLNVTVNVNAVPVLNYPSLTGVTAGGALVINPAVGPSDDGGALGQVLFNGSPALSVGPVYVAPVNSGAPAFAGTIQVSPSDARITVQNAGPVGD